MATERVTIGSVEVRRVVDGAMRGHAAFFFAGVPLDAAKAALRDDLDGDGLFTITIGSFLVRSGGRTVLIDTGMGAKNPATPGGALLDNLAREGVRPEDVDVVVNTHLHVDHVGWNCVQREGALTPTFPNAEYWVSREDWDYFTDAEVLAEEGPHLRTDVLPLRDSPQLRLIDGEAAITPELTLLATPGHTPGHRSVGIVSAGERGIVLGDIAHHRAHLERLWIAAVDELPRVSRRTKRRLAEQLVADGALVCAGHFVEGFGRLVLADGQRRWRPI